MANDGYDTLNKQKNLFISSVKKNSSQLIIVSNETNMGIVPMGDLSRRYSDEIGLIHQQLASICDNVVLMVAGLPLYVKQNGTAKM